MSCLGRLLYIHCQPIGCCRVCIFTVNSAPLVQYTSASAFPSGGSASAGLFELAAELLGRKVNWQ